MISLRQNISDTKKVTIINYLLLLERLTLQQSCRCQMKTGYQQPEIQQRCHHHITADGGNVAFSWVNETLRSIL